MQHMEALEKANDIRLARAQAKKEINRGVITPIDILETQPYYCDSMEIQELLLAMHRWGRSRVRKFLGYIDIHPTRRLDDLTVRQRSVLIETLKEKID